MKLKVEIKKVTTNEENVSARTVSYDLYVDGRYFSTHGDINDALDRKEEIENSAK
jgi:hypothetical protein